MRFIILIVLVSVWRVAGACYSLDASQTSPIEDLVAQSPKIYLGKVVGAKALGKAGGKVRTQFKFRVTEALKGDKVAELFIAGEPANKNFTTFDDHSKAQFWSPSGGSSKVQPDCTLVPSLSVGHEYLVFPDANHVKAIEPIASSRDQLVAKVRALVGK